MKKDCRELDSNYGFSDYKTDAPEGMAVGDVHYPNTIFDKLIQLLLHSKVAKAELYLIGGYHNEWIELTYYIETLS